MGDEVIYTFAVINHGPIDATGVKVTDSGLLKFEFVSASSDDYNPTTGVWTVGNLTDGSSVSLTVTVIINKIGTYPNNASVSSNENDTNMSNNNDASDGVTVSDSEPDDNDNIDENATGDVQEHSKVSILPETGNPIFIALLVFVTLILLPLRRR